MNFSWVVITSYKKKKNRKNCPVLFIAFVEQLICSCKACQIVTLPKKTLLFRKKRFNIFNLLKLFLSLFLCAWVEVVRAILFCLYKSFSLSLSLYTWYLRNSFQGQPYFLKRVHISCFFNSLCLSVNCRPYDISLEILAHYTISVQSI